ncbi:MAG: hypothetical protein NTY38_11775, partial [Acidobacteria bacterium]|nr:hypothetical protein [Acidobacteriota bacterium]
KPCSVKNKTITDLDLKLGAKKGNLGKVGHFEPELPKQGSMTNEEYSELTNRFNQRKEEFIKQNTVLKNNPNVKIKDGVVVDKATGKPFTGDHDIYDIVGLDGKPLPPDVKAQIIKELEQPPFTAQHGAHMDWKYNNLSPDVPPGSPPGTVSDLAQAQNIDTKIMNSHSVGGEPLISFGPGRPPQAAYFVGRR